VPAIPKAVLGLDVGDRRIGVAIASLTARLPRPLTTLLQDDSFPQKLRDIITAESIEAIVIGFPRGQDGQPTAQTTVVQAFADELRAYCEMPIHFQDESVTSKQAEAELEARGKPYQRPDIDALAATYILEDFLAEHRELAA
jgi:putative Holliday junction resolvase